MEQLPKLLDENPIFAHLTKAEQMVLVGHSTRRELQEGEVLALQGDVWPYMFLIEKGEIEAVKVSSEGRNLLITSFKEGELFWGPAFFHSDAVLPVTLQAGRHTSVYLWTRDFAEKIFLQNGRMSWELCRLMIQRMQRASAIVEELAFRPVAGRLARFLLDDFANAGDTAIARRLTLDDIAARLGTTREMVCRILYRFAGDKLIDVTRTEFILTDREGLARIADGS